VQRSIQDFAAAAQALQALLLQARAAGGSPLLASRQVILCSEALVMRCTLRCSAADTPLRAQEERELREELAAKEALLRACAERLADWQARCARVAAELRAAAAL